jgi:hypothetical protein
MMEHHVINREQTTVTRNLQLDGASWTIGSACPPSPRFPQVCSICGDLEREMPHVFTLSDLQKSSQTGCASCEVTLAIL